MDNLCLFMIRILDLLLKLLSVKKEIESNCRVASVFCFNQLLTHVCFKMFISYSRLVYGFHSITLTAILACLLTIGTRSVVKTLICFSHKK